jgi:SAM-dependent methyltransferase
MRKKKGAVNFTEGYIEAIEGDQICGWAWDELHPGTPTSLDVYDGKTLLATISAEQFRQDLLDAGIGDGKHGFLCTLPRALRGGRRHAVRVKVSGTDVELPRPEPEFPGDVPTPPDRMLLATGIRDASSFKENAQGVARSCKALGKLKPDGSVLDVGCGAGRLAIPLTQYLNDRGDYDGMDINAEMINWCRENISKKYTNFHFQHSDIYNGFYNPHGKRRAAEYEFPYAGDSFDLVFLGSVFTHLLPAEVDHYLSEISRVLRGGGRAMISFFLLENGLLKKGNKKSSWLDFQHEREGYRTINKDMPEAAVAYEEEHVRTLYQRHGFNVVEPIHYGEQDLVVAVRI